VNTTTPVSVSTYQQPYLLVSPQQKKRKRFQERRMFGRKKPSPAPSASTVKRKERGDELEETLIIVFNVYGPSCDW